MLNILYPTLQKRHIKLYLLPFLSSLF